MIFNRKDGTDPTLNVTSSEQQTVAEKQAEAPAAAPPRPLRIYTTGHVAAGSFLGGPLGGFWLIRKNAQSFGDPAQASRALKWGLLGTLLVVSLVAFLDAYIPDKADKLIPAIYVAAIGLICNHWQGPRIKEAMAAGAKRGSTLKMIGICLVSLLFTIIVFFPVQFAKDMTEPGMAEATVGDMYNSGFIVDEKPEEATAWYKKSAEKKHPIGQLKLAYSYENGIGVKQDGAEAVRLLDLAAQQGNAMAQMQAAFHYMDGKGVAVDTEKAKALLNKSAEQRFAPALNAMGMMHENGIGGTPKNDVEAFFWYSLAAGEDIDFEEPRDRLRAQLKPEEVFAVKARTLAWERAHRD